MRNPEQPLPEGIEMEPPENDRESAAPTQNPEAQQGGWWNRTPEEIEELRRDPRNWEYVQSIVEEQYRRQSPEYIAQQQRWLAKDMGWWENFIRQKKHSKQDIEIAKSGVGWGGLSNIMESGKGSRELIQFALEHPHRVVVQAAATHHRLGQEKLKAVLGRAETLDLNSREIKKILEAQVRLTLDEVARLQQETTEIQRKIEEIDRVQEG